MDEIVYEKPNSLPTFLEQPHLEGKLDVRGVLRSRVYPTVADRDTRQGYFSEVVEDFVCCLRTRWSLSAVARESDGKSEGKTRGEDAPPI
jgi:hypothetical protein